MSEELELFALIKIDENDKLFSQLKKSYLAILKKNIECEDFEQIIT